MLSQVDARLSKWAFENIGNQMPRDIWMGLEHSGNGLVWLPLAIGVLCVPSLSPQARYLAANFLLGFLTDLAIVGIMKGIARRPRPSYNKASDFTVVVPVDKWSFPSGHASRVIYMACFANVVAIANGSHMGITTTIWGIIVAFSRALLGRHYLGDVCAGAIVGILNAALISQGTFDARHLIIPRDTSEQLYAEACLLFRSVLGN